ncbi:hybrid sensor histidine kinase/response regulator transcription factor [Cognaticolwellia mytili]|uniref:hybrid sensor histidine kinase/response regulator transcription factor n=1 Tax=Cognaticolwellia mytili TaxID=1888913 RepID=UPI000A16CD7F|nr:ATP-binding protein [Cognaticolwellia mytili]
MQITSRKVFLALSIVLTLLPYYFIGQFFAPNNDIWQVITLLLLQMISASFVVISYLRIISKQLKLFWQFMSLAVTSALISHFLLNFTLITHNLFLVDFFSLFSYFFILLAIETKPHISKTRINRNISSRVPAIFFTLTCFSYLVVLPLEFAATNAAKVLSSKLFHLLIVTLIFMRLVVTSYQCRGKHWCQIYCMLAIAAAAMLVNNSITYFNLFDTFSYIGAKNIISLPSYFFNLLTLLPYCALIFAANSSLAFSVTATETQERSMPELYLILLTVTLISFHLAGIELNLHYKTPSYLQSLLVITWLVIAFSLLTLIAYRKNKQNITNEQQISLQKSAQDELVKLNLLLTNSMINSEDKAIVNVSSNAILTTAVDGKVLSANPAAVQLFQCLEREIVGSRVNSFFSSDDEMHYFFDFKSNVYTLQRKEVGISKECTAIRKDGTNFPVQAELQWADRDEKPLVVITFINLTARKLAEQQALDLKDKFIANISHEFRTPLTIINGILDRYLIKQHTDEEGKELQTAKRNGLRLVRMVEQLLELSRLSDNPKLTIATYRLHTLMAMPADSFARLAKQNNLSLSCDIPDDIWLECDAQAFEKIIFNLIANAIKYTPAGGDIKVMAHKSNDHFTLDIIDTGIGIDSASQAKIFERFQRADDEKNRGVFGVGIGLSLVSELVKAHQWKISVVSEYNNGSKFSLTIPCTPAIEDEKSTPTSISQTEVSSLLVEQHQSHQEKKPAHQKVILVIEDNLDMQTHIKQVIEQQHHCLLADSGEQGLVLAQEYMPDLIVCDIMLTGIDGFAVLKQLKSHEMTSHIPVILLTARSDLDSRLYGLNLQADEYLSKPFNHQELLTRISNLIAGRAQLQKNYFENFKKDLQKTRKDNSFNNVADLTQVDSEELTLDSKFLEKLEMMTAKVYMDTDLDIIRLATEMAMSERQLQRKIKVLLGITPNNFIKEFRLKKAKVLLQNGSQIGRIALDVGFSSQTYFGRCFKEHYACTPKQYQQQLQQKQRLSS